MNFKSLENFQEQICPGSKIRSRGRGRGLGIGKGKGPIGRMAERDVFNQIKKGFKFRWNNKDWTVKDIKKGNAIVQSKGIPSQKIDLLKLTQWIEDGKAENIHENTFDKFSKH